MDKHAERCRGGTVGHSGLLQIQNGKKVIAAAMMARSAGGFAPGAQAAAAGSVDNEQPAFTWEFQGQTATCAGVSVPELQEEGWGKERPTERVYKTQPQLDPIRSWATTWVRTGSGNSIPAKGKQQILLLSELGPELTDQQISASFAMFAKLARTQNVPGGGTDHAAVSNNTERQSGAAQSSTEPASTSAAPKRKRGRPSKAVAQAAAAAANTSGQDQQVQALAHYVDVQQERTAEQRAEQAQSVKRSTRLLRNAAARRGPVPADLHDDIPASSDEAHSERRGMYLFCRHILQHPVVFGSTLHMSLWGEL